MTNEISNVKLIVTVSAVAMLLFLAFSPFAVAQVYPAKAVRFIVAFPPSSTSDTLARLIAQKLTQLWGQPIIIDNRPGAGGQIAASMTAAASPDGYTMLLASTSFIILPILAKVPYDPLIDFYPVRLVSRSTVILVVSPSLPAKSVPELIALAKSRPGELSYGSSGSGGNPRMAMELFKSMAGLDILHVPYKGMPPAIPDLLSGRIHLMFSTVVPVLPLIKQGKLRALAVSTLRRSPAVPDVPPMADFLPGFESAPWQGILAPQATPLTIIRKMDAALREIIETPEIGKRMLEMGFEPASSTPANFAAFMKSDIAKWSKIIQAAAIGRD